MCGPFVFPWVEFDPPGRRAHSARPGSLAEPLSGSREQQARPLSARPPLLRPVAAIGAAAPR